MSKKTARQRPEQRPLEGGSYLRLPDGSLQRQAEPEPEAEDAAGETPTETTPASPEQDGAGELSQEA